MKHLLSTKGLTRDDAAALLHIAEDRADVAGREVKKLPTSMQESSMRPGECDELPNREV
jgi:aspartate carbamoyltransferase catalytic subunit